MGKNKGKVKAPVETSPHDYTPYTLEELSLARYIYGSRGARSAHRTREVLFMDGTSQIMKTPIRWPLSPTMWVQKPRRAREVEVAAIEAQIEHIIRVALQE